MTVNVSLVQFVHLKQPASSYLVQLYEISSKLQDLIEALKLLLLSIQASLKSAYTMLDKGLIPVIDLIDLNIAQTEGVALLRQAASEIESYKGFEDYSNALTQQLQELKTETYELLSGSTHHIKASKLEIKALYERYAKALDLLKQIAL